MSFTFFFLIQCRDTYWVESFNHQLLSYLPKRIHFGNATFLMRMNLAVLDWIGSYGNTLMQAWLTCTCTFQNENSQRAHTSARLCLDLPRPDQRTAMKVLVRKTFHFVDRVWEAYVAANQQDLR